MNEEQMTPEQREAVDNLAQSQSQSESTPAVSTADLASAGEREASAPQATPAAEDQRPDDQAQDVGVQPRDMASPETAQALPATSDTRQPQTGDEPRSSDQREAERTPVMSDDAAEEYRARWQETQADFVDDPRTAVTTADALVAEVMKRVAEEFANERSGLERQWNEGGEASTEDLRLAFQRYRSFFSRLLSL
jgi:hypothetical protein